VALIRIRVGTDSCCFSDLAGAQDRGRTSECHRGLPGGRPAVVSLSSPAHKATSMNESPVQIHRIGGASGCGDGSTMGRTGSGVGQPQGGARPRPTGTEERRPSWARLVRTGCTCEDRSVFGESTGRCIRLDRVGADGARPSSWARSSRGAWRDGRTPPRRAEHPFRVRSRDQDVWRRWVGVDPFVPPIGLGHGAGLIGADHVGLNTRSFRPLSRGIVISAYRTVRAVRPWHESRLARRAVSDRPDPQLPPDVTGRLGWVLAAVGCEALAAALLSPVNATPAPHAPNRCSVRPCEKHWRQSEAIRISNKGLTLLRLRRTLTTRSPKGVQQWP
jgi:hypothetical protein